MTPKEELVRRKLIRSWRRRVETTLFEMWQQRLRTLDRLDATCFRALQQRSEDHGRR